MDPKTALSPEIEALVGAGLTRGRAIVLSHLERFRVSTLDIIHTHLGGDPEATKSVVRGLREHNPPLVASAELDGGGHRYYFLTRNGWEKLGKPRTRTGPYAPVALVHLYGALAFCHRSSGRDKLTQRQFKERYPSLVSKGLEDRWYYEDFDDEDAPKLGYIHVNCGGLAKAERHKFRWRIIGGRLEHYAWRTEVINAGGFAVGVVAANADKLEQLRAALEPTWPGVAFRFEVVSELDDIRDFGASKR